MPETTPLIKAALNLRVGAGFDVYSDAVSWFKRNRNRTNVRKIFTINIWYVIIILSNGGTKKNYE